MAGQVSDTNKLINQWKRRREAPHEDYTPADAEAWASELIQLHKTNWIVTPVYLEFIGGVGHRKEMELARAFLGAFSILDGGDIRPDDWTKARQLAERIPPDSKPRGAVDCLIRAIAIRLRCEVLTDDGGMPRHP